MRKFTLIFALVAFTGFVFAQNAPMVQNALTKSGKTQVVKNTTVKTGGDVLFTEDFDGQLPDTWTNVDLSDQNMPWFWTADSVFGTYTHGYIESETAANGFMTMNADGYNSIPQFSADGVISPDLHNADGYIQSPAYDFSGQIGVILEFHQQYRFFTGMLYDVMASADYDPANPDLAHWSTYNVNDEIGINDPSLDQIKKVNISEVAAGQSSVYIRFYAHNSTHYYWNIDDVAFTVPFEDNMVLTNTWNFYAWETTPPANSVNAEGNLQHGGFYYLIPKDFAQPFIGFQGAVQNSGLNDETNVIMTSTISYKDTISADYATAETFTSVAKDIGASDLDSLHTEDGANSYTPSEWGYYRIDHNVSMDNTEGYSEDNTDTISFIVNDSTYSRTTETLTSTCATRNWIGAGEDGDGLGVHYTLTQNTEVFGLKFYFSKRNTDDYADYITAGTFTYIARIFAYDFENDDWQTSAVISSALGVITMADTGVWLSIDFEKDGSAEYLQAGDYMAYLETATGIGPGIDDNHRVGFYLGEDLSVPQPDVVTHLWAEGTWGWVSAAPMIRLVVGAENWTGNDNRIGVEETRVDPFKDFSLGQNFPNPASAQTEVKYKITKNANVTLSVYDVTGKRVILVEEGNKTAGRYSINLNVEDLNAGVYYYTLTAGQYESSKKMVVLK